MTGSINDYRAVTDQLVDWHGYSKKGLTVLVIGRCEFRWPTKGGTQRVQGTPRVTATSIQTSQLEQGRQALENEGNFSMDISTKWRCTKPSCGHYPLLCWWQGRDSPECHWPISQPVFQAWTLEIAGGVSTAEEPSGKIVGQMAMNRDRGSRVKDKGKEQNKSNSGGSSITLNLASMGALQTPSTPQAQAQALSSSPFRMPASQSSTIELVREFFRWCKKEVAYRGEEDMLGRLEQNLSNEGYSVSAIAAATFEEWRHAGCGAGYRPRLRESAKQWLRGRQDQLLATE